TKQGVFVDSNGNGITNVGDRVEYTFVVTNTGNTTLTHITVTDDNAVVTGGPLASLGVGAIDATTFKAVHLITQADIDAALVYNLAIIAATPSSGPDITETSTDPVPCTACPVDPACPDCTITPLTPVSSIAIIKKAVFTDENKDGYTQVGETIKYSFEIKNTGQTSLTNVIVTDNLAGLVLSGSPVNLAVGEVNNTSFTGVYTITQADINAGSVANQAMVEATTPSGAKVNDLSDNDSFTGDGSTVIDITDCVIEVFNAVSPNADGFNDVFSIKGLECYPDNTVEIYNRWGVKVFETNNYNSNGNVFKGYSDGRATISRNEILPDGTYFYTLKYLDNTSVWHSKSGYLYINK
ncbi:gliding motility-associated C-terminal domain-containing protein, partial [Flavobacterium sp. FlaQc-48]|uniref:gliding motility-associated C-terminal domain-containing protein n=1 Tax=Flavobacterium sp. FlaQc-48 TaxID=3374181 RepID=UPI003756F30D